MAANTKSHRLDRAINSLEEYVQGVWEGDEGIQSVIESLRIVQAEHATCDELRKIAHGCPR